MQVLHYSSNKRGQEVYQGSVRGLSDQWHQGAAKVPDGERKGGAMSPDLRGKSHLGEGKKRHQGSDTAVAGEFEGKERGYKYSGFIFHPLSNLTCQVQLVRFAPLGYRAGKRQKGNLRAKRHCRYSQSDARWTISKPALTTWLCINSWSWNLS